MNHRPLQRTLWTILAAIALLSVPRSSAQEYFYFDTNTFYAYEGTTFTGTLRRGGGSAPETVYILIITNTSGTGVNPINVPADTSGLQFVPQYYYQVPATFASGATAANFSFSLTQNGSAQSDKGFVFSMAPPWGPSAPPGTLQQAWFILQDNDGPMTPSVWYSQVVEGDGNLFYFDRGSDNYRGPMTVYFTLEGTATRDTDFQMWSGFPLSGGPTYQLTIPSGYSQAWVEIDTLRDAAAEASETATVRIQPNSGQYTVPNPATATMTILDDTPRLETFFWESPVLEGEGTWLVIQRTNTPYVGTPACTVTYQVTGTATKGTDYADFGGSAVLPSGQSGSNYVLVPITTYRDMDADPDETVIVTLTSGTNYYIIPNQGSDTLTIADDTPIVGVVATNSTIVEGGAPTALIFYNNNAHVGSPAVSFNYSTGGTAANGGDYTYLSGAGTIPAGQWSVTNVISATSDSLVEGTETASATIQSSANYLVDGVNPSATVYIQDDYPVINVQATDDHAAESASEPGEFTISRSGNLSQAVTVQLNITGTATAGVDYVGLPTNVTFAAGVGITNLTVTPLANDGIEAAETIVLGLKTNASYLLGLDTNAVVTIVGDGPNPRDTYPKGPQYVRGSGTNMNAYSIVVPVDGLTGTRRADMDPIYHYATNYHYNATNALSQNHSTNRIPFNTPIASFGGGWGSPLYLGQSYSLGMFFGLNNGDPLIIYAYRRSDGGLEGWVTLAPPLIDDPSDWSNFVTNGFARATNAFGLTTVLRVARGVSLAGASGGIWLTHTASDAATNYLYLICAAGTYDGQYMALDSANSPAFNYFYDLYFEPRPAWRSLFVDQAHFQGQPLPPDLWNKTPDELLNYGAAVTNAISLAPSACTNLDQSPELRRHPILDQFVADMSSDPLALANYVQNEIDLSDPIAYRDDGSVATESINEGGVNRGALGVYLEGRGSPVEQCALLVYFLRQAGYPATYVFPPEGGLKMLDTRLSALLRMRINGALDSQGRAFTTNQLISVSYPWVATYISNQWVHLFPWAKDTSVEEGLDVRDYLPDPYKDTQVWVKDYALGKTNIMAFATLDDDTPGTIFPRFLDNALKQNSPGISVEDIGIKCVNRRHLYAQWSDFPRPTWVTNVCTAVESLASSAITNVSPTLTNIFDTLQVELYSVNNPQKEMMTPALRMADLHNRKLYLTHTNLGNGQIQAALTLAPYRPASTDQGNFSVNDTALTNKQVLTLNLDSTDDRLRLRLRHRRQRALSWETALDPDRSFLSLVGPREIAVERPLRVGDVGAICLDAGRVTPAMLRVHAQEIWNMEHQLSTNAASASSISPDVYQGSLVYLLGMNYYERYSRFDNLFRRLFKVQRLSSFAMGLSKISPRRNPDGTLYNGTVDPIWPNVDMFFQEVVNAGNGTVRPDSGWDMNTAMRDYNSLSIADGSAQEHATLNIFFGKSNSVSTVKLLQLAQSNTATGGSNVVELTIYNVLSAGNVSYGGLPLQYHDPNLWSEVLDAFSRHPFGFAVGYVTPGTQTTPSGSFSGMAALVLGSSLNLGLISDQYGGFADPLSPGSVAAANTPAFDLYQLAENDYTMDFTTPQPNQQLPGQETTTWFDSPEFAALLNNNAVSPNPYQDLAGQAEGLVLNGVAGSFQSAYPQAVDVGVVSTRTDARDGNGPFLTVADPVNALTGEFYVDEVDLSLPGPMPLQVRRNYGSQNLAFNELGYGWKLNYMPYLSVASSNDIVYEAEADGSVLAFGLIGTNLWVPTLALNPTLNNDSAHGIGSLANRLNARLAKHVVGGTNTWYLTNGNGSLRIFQELSFPLTNSTVFDRLRPYLTFWYDNRSNYYRFEYGTNPTQADYGQVRRIVSSSGNVVRFEYDVYARIVDAYSLDGRRVQYEYDEHGDLVTVTLPDTSQIHYEYQLLDWGTNVYSTHLLLSEEKPDGRVLQNAYDDQRRVTNQWATVGPDLRLVRNATFRYTNNFALTNLTATLTGTTTILDYTNNPTSYFYTNGLIRRIRDALGSEIVQDWYEATETNAPAYPRSLKTLTDQRGLVTTYLYDSQGNATNTTLRGDLKGDGDTNATATSVATYNANNLPTKIVDASGTTNLFFYTNTWLLARAEIWPANAAAAQAVTNLHTYTTVTNGADGTISCGLRSQEIRAAFSPDAATNQWTYSARGFPIQATRYTSTGDPAVVFTNLFNTRGELAQQTDAAGCVARLAYNPRGSIQALELFDAGSSTPMFWDYSYYNDNGELTWSDGSRFNPEDYVWRDYDGAGRKLQEIHWRAQAKTDGAGVEAPSGDELYATTFYEYDAAGNLTRVTDPLGNCSLKKYNAIGRLTREEFYDASAALLATNGFAYNAAGDVTNTFNALGGSAQTQYTSAGKRKFVRGFDGATNGWTYYADGRLRREILNNGAYWETTYDCPNRKTTRTFYSAAGSPLATNVTVLDRRGNTVQTVDAGFNVFTNLFDGLDRLKISAGPATVTVTEDCGTGVPGCGIYVTNVSRQITTYTFDASGKTITVANALGDRTVTTFDPLDRPVSAQTYASGGFTPLRVTTTAYSQDYHSTTVTEGTEASAISTTTYTGNDGQSLLSVAHPSGNILEFTWRQYDLGGNLGYEERDSSVGGAVSSWSASAYGYDGLNRVIAKADRDNAQTYYRRDPAGNITNRVMPGGLQWSAIYNSAGQMLQEWNTGTDGSGTRTNTYAYYPSGDPSAGLLQTATDPLGIVCSYDYDDYLRVASTIHESPLNTNLSITTWWTYNSRGLLTDVTEHFPYIYDYVGVSWDYDAYGQLDSELTEDQYTWSFARQTWDTAGRRTGLGLDMWWTGQSYSFGWRADGLLASAAMGAAKATYGYNDAGVLTNRSVGSRSTTTLSLDGTGRPLSITTKAGLLTKLAETLTWTGDGLLATHTLARQDFTDSRSYDYAPSSRRLSVERLNLDATKRWTNSLTYDGGVAAGPGALTRVGRAPGSAEWSAGTDAFSRVSTETNNVSARSAYGRANGESTITALLDGQPVPVSAENTYAGNWPISWRASLPLSPGTHQLSVTAAHPSGFFTTNCSVWFTNNAAYEKVSETHDAAGRLTQRVWLSPSGTTNRTETLTWDVKGRLWYVTGKDAQGNGYGWYATYDALGRKLLTQTWMTTNTTQIGGVDYAWSFYDPAAEFLELGVGSSQGMTWKLYGPDLNGTYGGLSGVGGLEGVQNGIAPFQPAISDARGNVLGAVTNGVSVSWNPARPTGYGAPPGYRPLSIATGANMAQASAWRGKWPETTGYIYLGARHYDPESGTFLSGDPVWNGRDPNYYTFCGGDPINYTDPDGRLALERDLRNLYDEFLAANGYVAGQAAAFQTAMATGDMSVLFRDETRFFEDMIQGAWKGDYATDAGAGGAFGNAVGSSIPGVGTVAGLRDLSASVGNMGDGGWRQGRNWANLGITSVAAVPFLGWVKGVARVEHAGAEVARVSRAVEATAQVGRQTAREAEGFVLARHGEMPSPRLGRESHHGAMSRWMEENYPGYNPDLAPAVLMPEQAHNATRGVYNSWRAEMRQRMGGAFDWSQVSEADMRALSDRMFEASGTPRAMQEAYWQWFDRMKAALERAN